jgi:Fe(II)/alpha-ketoglutarate-dependent arginine beta-hydroxylase
MDQLTLSDSEIVPTLALLAEIAQRFDSAEDPGFLRQAPVYAQELPRKLRIFLNDFRLLEPQAGYCVISGFPIDDEKIGVTPRHWKDRVHPTPTLEADLFLVLVGSLLGEPIGWSTQQGGSVVHDIFPIAGHEKEQIATGSEDPLTWHTEDAFHPYRGDYLALLCLRNPDRVGTSCATLDTARLSPRHRQLLFEPLFTIRPDESHLPKTAAQQSCDEKSNKSYEHIFRMNDAPPKIAVLSGSPEQPYIRIDPYFMDRVEDDAEAQAALEALIAHLDSRIETVVSSPGDIFVLDNFRMVHGRQPFKARYDGHDRWLKRINISRNLRGSRSLRDSADARVLHG